MEGTGKSADYEEGSADYILNGDAPDNLDPIVNEAIEILNNLKTDKAKKSALAMLKQIQILEDEGSMFNSIKTTEVNETADSAKMSIKVLIRALL
ncbi:hypothetical protein FYJ34_02505 [Clostridiaceae bacterium 68-1-5]|uniref:Uncharacterized protein n=1 Tax=Suipraeoptans intestinalis TaxID=2606628 RepID=A0A6N7UY55_9FIRM|nr:hypothetical protein [Suipraeoptans intestinalis]MSR93179.1 hypothetical protein [Suipraeoptans intestinalis]